jgi:hypothetical protein
VRNWKKGISRGVNLGKSELLRRVEDPNRRSPVVQRKNEIAPAGTMWYKEGMKQLV